MDANARNNSVRSTKKRAREEEEKNKIILGVVTFVIAAISTKYERYQSLIKEPLHDWGFERRCYLNRMYNGREFDCVEQLRVSKQGFKNICKILSERGGLIRTRHIPISEAVAMFLHILAHGLKYRVIQFDFYRSKETISRQFNNVLRAILRVSKEYVKLRNCIIQEPETSKWKWFENCLGALDETHIPVTVNADDRPRYRNRKGDISTNVLGACAPDMKFIYVLPGWEGSASDSRVLRDALRRCDRLHIPNDKYFLVDAGYTNGPGFLAPYRGTRYHLNEWIGNNPENYKELFNLRHSTARNVVERSFGLLKKRWAILRVPSFFDIKTQIRIINACFILHNFIRIEQDNDPILEAADLEFLDSVDQEINQAEGIDSNSTEEEITFVQVTNEWTAFRENLGMHMFTDYQARRLGHAM